MQQSGSLLRTLAALLARHALARRAVSRAPDPPKRLSVWGARRAPAGISSRLRGPRKLRAHRPAAVRPKRCARWNTHPYRSSPGSPYENTCDAGGGGGVTPPPRAPPPEGGVVVAPATPKLIRPRRATGTRGTPRPRLTASRPTAIKDAAIGKGSQKGARPLHARGVGGEGEEGGTATTEVAVGQRK